MPYHSWDALSFGEWSRLIAQTGRFHFPALTPSSAQRPLFYVLQGWIWRWLGFDEAYGRALALGFGIALVSGVALLAARLEAAFRRRAAAAALSAAILLAVPHVAEGFCSGLVDVPVAAVVAACALAMWGLEESAARSALLVLLAALAILTKPSSAPALLGLGAAHAIGCRERLGVRVARGCVPIAAGIVLGLAYDVAEARNFDMGIGAFLTDAIGGYYARLSSSMRAAAFWNFDWLGPGLRFLLVYALSYAVFRTAGLRHRLAGGASAAGAAAMFFLGPRIAGGAVAGQGRWDLLVSLFFLAASVAAASRPDEQGPDRARLARLFVWALPVVAAWTWGAAYDARLLSPAWPALVLLIVAALLPAIRGPARLRGFASITLAAGLFIAGVRNVRRIDGLPWKEVQSLVFRGETRPAVFRRLALGDFDRVRDLLAQRMSPAERVLSSDGRLRFYFPGRADQSYPRGCRSLKDRAYFVLLTDPASRAYLEREIGVSGDPAFWDACREPALTRIATYGSWCVYRVAASPVSAGAEGIR